MFGGQALLLNCQWAEAPTIAPFASAVRVAKVAATSVALRGVRRQVKTAGGVTARQAALTCQLRIDRPV